jgi:ligand-binding sensor domain-containing protein
MNFVLKIWLQLLCSGSFFLSAQTYNWEVFSTDNSPLPNNTIRTLLKGIENDIWIGTDLGLSHFDGTNWTTYNADNSPLSDNNVRTLCWDQDNRLWIGTISGGIYVFDGLIWTQHTMSNSGLPSNFIRTIASDQQGAMWIGTVEGLVRFDGDNWMVWTIDNAGFQTNNISAIAVDDNDRKIIGTINGGLLFYNDTTFEQLTLLEHGLPALGILFGFGEGGFERGDTYIQERNRSLFTWRYILHWIR